MKDKRVIDNFLKHAETSNRVLEEEHCWREIKRNYNNNNNKSSNGSVSSGISQKTLNSNFLITEQNLDAYERALRLEAKKHLEITAARTLPSAAGGQHAKEFWRGLIRQKSTLDRWGHDGWEELQAEGPLPPSLTENDKDGDDHDDDNDDDRHHHHRNKPGLKRKSYLDYEKAAKRQLKIERALEKQTRKLDKKRKLLKKMASSRSNGKYSIKNSKHSRRGRSNRSCSTSSSSTTSSFSGSCSCVSSNCSKSSDKSHSKCTASCSSSKSSSSSSNSSCSASGDDQEGSSSSSIESGDEIEWQES